MQTMDDALFDAREGRPRAARPTPTPRRPTRRASSRCSPAPPSLAGRRGRSPRRRAPRGYASLRAPPRKSARMRRRRADVADAGIAPPGMRRWLLRAAACCWSRAGFSPAPTTTSRCGWCSIPGSRSPGAALALGAIAVLGASLVLQPIAERRLAPAADPAGSPGPRRSGWASRSCCCSLSSPPTLLLWLAGGVARGRREHLPGRGAGRGRARRGRGPASRCSPGWPACARGWRRRSCAASRSSCRAGRARSTASGSRRSATSTSARCSAATSRPSSSRA